MIKNNSTSIKSNSVRKASVFLSSLCAIHCLIVPIFVTILPVVGHYIKLNFWLEMLIYSSILFLGGGLMLADYKHHKIKTPLIFFVTGFITIVGSHFILNLLLSNIFIIFGGIGLAVGQLNNIRLHKKLNKVCCNS